MPKHIIAAMGLAVIFAFSTLAEQPTPSPLPQPSVAGQQDQKAEEDKQQTKPEQAVPQPTQPIVKVPQREETQKETKPNSSQPPKEATESKGWSLSDKIASVASFIAAIQSIALFWTILEMRRSSRRELRAYVFLDCAAPLDGTTVEPQRLDFANVPAASLLIKNCGQTPAYRVLSWGAITIADNGDESSLVVPKLSVRSSTNLGSGAVMPKIVKFDRALSESEIEGIKVGKKAIYVYGRIEYEDAFKVRRFTNFRLGWSGEYPPPISSSFTLCNTGNETERDT